MAPSLNLPVESSDITGSLMDTRPIFSMHIIDDVDRPRALAALGQALDPMNDGQMSGWTGQSGQRRGSFSARGLAFIHEDRLCREFLAALEVKQSAKDVERQQWPGTACRQDLGPWTVVDVPRPSQYH